MRQTSPELPAVVGASLGAGVVLVLDHDHDTCALGELLRVARWLAAQSSGQCGPCVFGLAALVDDLALQGSG